MQAAEKAAVIAGQRIMEIYRTDFSVDHKKDDSPLTLADRQADEAIREILQETGIPILSEEGREIPFRKRENWGEFWMIDPLDGTREFVKRNGEFTVNIALIKNGYPQLGVVYAPVTGDLYSGISNEAAFKKSGVRQPGELANTKGEKLPLISTDRPYTVVASRSHLNEPTRDFLEKLKKEQPNLKTISAGSSLKLCLVAEGRADLYPRPAPTMEWDTAAGDAICRAAGCRVIDWNTGKSLVYNKENLLNPWFKVIRDDR